jgi:hypothetical protein
MEFLMLLHQPTPDAVPDIEVKSCENDWVRFSFFKLDCKSCGILGTLQA